MRRKTYDLLTDTAKRKIALLFKQKVKAKHIAERFNITLQHVYYVVKHQKGNE